MLILTFYVLRKAPLIVQQNQNNYWTNLNQTYHQPFFSLAFALDIFALCSAALQTKNGKKLPQVQTQLSKRNMFVASIHFQVQPSLLRNAPIYFWYFS
jgi:hypothetical protein